MVLTIEENNKLINSNLRWYFRRLRQVSTEVIPNNTWLLENLLIQLWRKIKYTFISLLKKTFTNQLYRW